MIVGIDHVVIAVRDIEAGVAAYETLLGRRASAVEVRDGVAIAKVATEDVAVELMAPVGDDGGSARLRAALDEGGEGLKSLVFAVSDLDAMHRRAARVGLQPEVIKHGVRRSFRAETERAHGVRLFFIEQMAPSADPGAHHDVSALDHVVIRTANPERAAALYGARLELDMRLDREWRGRRLLFFRCGNAIVEIADDGAITSDRDQLWGLSWRVLDADTARGRLAEAGLDVSEVRVGMKPGTRVFTVRDGTCGVPTLMIEASSNRD